MLSVCISQFLKRHESGVSHFGQVFDTMVKVAPGSHRGANLDPESGRSTEGVEYPQEGFRLIVGPVLVDGHVDILKTEDGRDLEKGREQVGYDVERVVEVDGEKVLVVVRGVHGGAGHLIAV